MTVDAFNYDIAFARNVGLLREDEQARLRKARAAVAGMGGMGGAHLMTLTRLGLGGFHLADYDSFELVNFNRQVGASTASVGRPKVEVMAEMARSVNPDLKLRTFSEPVGPGNLNAFLDGVDVVLDGLDFFHLDDRRRLFNAARRRGIPVVSSGPIGFSAILQVWTPDSMEFDRYFDLHDGQSEQEQLLRFAVGIAPGGTHLPYTDLSSVDLEGGAGPSLGLAVQMAAGLAAGQVAKLLLERGPIRPVPHYFQIDAYTLECKQGRLWFGNRHPLQRLKIWYVRRLLTKGNG
ncbi:MAG: ThiF family adenylyltransferase [Anaerolineales bacterium]|nr:ThiF family adenylyltransferase [Anaerolineales bacterium]